MTEKFKFSCPKCSKSFRVDGSVAGRKVSCAQCGYVFRLQTPKPVVVAEVAPELAEADYVSQIPVIPTHQTAQQSDFQSQLKQKRGQAPNQLSRKEQLALGRRRSHERMHFDWATGSWGIALIILGFVSISMPNAESVRGGRGVIKLLGQALFALGPFAPVLGMFLGLGGVAIVINATKNFPKLLTGIVASGIAVILIMGCVMSFMAASNLELPALNPGNEAEKYARKNPASAPKVDEDLGPTDNWVLKQERKFREEMDAMEQESDFPGVEFRQGNSSVPTNESPRKPRAFNSDRRDWPRSTRPSLDPFESNNARRDGQRQRPGRQRQRQRAASGFCEPGIRWNGRQFTWWTPVCGSANFIQSDSTSRDARGVPLPVFMSGKKYPEFDFGAAIGSDQGIGRIYFDEDSAVPGVVFANQHGVSLLPAQAQERESSLVSKAEPGEYLYGFNMDFELGRLNGIQPIYATSPEPEPQELRNGEWMGSQPRPGTMKTLHSNGRPIHGFLIFKRGNSVSGLQLIIKK